MPFRCLRGPRAAILFFACAAAALPASAAADTPPARPDPTRIEAEVPALQHRSALQQYRRLTDEPRRDWRAANAEVARIGGWRAYLREAHTPEPASPAPAASPTTAPPTAPILPPAAAPAPHHGHGAHGGRR